MIKAKSRKKLLYMPVNFIVAIAAIFFLNICTADDVWKLLERDGDAMELMALESVGNGAVLIGAKYDQQHWQAASDSKVIRNNSPIIRKQLHIIRMNQKESIEWQRSYPAIPDVNEIFSVSATTSGRLCVAYGKYHEESEFINPVMLQVDSSGKIIWANNKAILESSLVQSKFKQSKNNDSVQIANLDSIRIIGTPDNGCLLGYILRRQSGRQESYELHLLSMDSEGNQKWSYSSNTRLYGKMFLTQDIDDKQYTVVQTNQSRDAAIKAMMAAKPFSPETSTAVITLDGELKTQHENIVDLSKVWIKSVMDAPGNSIVLVGNSSNAWLGHLNAAGHIERVFNTLGGEFSFVSAMKPTGYLLVSGESMVAISDAFAPVLNQPIGSLVKKKYSNPLLDKQIQESVPVQNIVPLEKNTYLLLYGLGSRLLKIDLTN